MTNNKWVTYEQAKPYRWQTLFSTRERRIATVTDGGTVLAVAPVGNLRVPLFLEYDSLAFVHMVPKQVRVEFNGNVRTKDGISVAGSINIQAFVLDDDGHIKRVVNNAEDEERLLCSCAMTAVQDIVASRKWYEVIQVGEELTKAVYEKLFQLLKNSESCFGIKSLAIHEISPIDKALAQAIEEESVKQRLASLRADRADIERTAKQKETQNELDLNELRHKSELMLVKKKEETKIEIQKMLSDLLMTEAGRIAALPEKDRLPYLREAVQSNGLFQRVIGIVEGIRGTVPDSILRIQQQRVGELVAPPHDQEGNNVAAELDPEKDKAASEGGGKSAVPEQNKKLSEKDEAG